jgi:hypothetical protein
MTKGRMLGMTKGRMLGMTLLDMFVHQELKIYINLALTK